MASKAKSLHVTLPPKLRSYVDKQVKKEGYSTNSDYIQSLIRKEIKFQEQKKLEKMLLEGLASGQKEYSKTQWNEFRKKLVNKYSK